MANLSSARRRLLGLALREYREKAGYAMETAADVLECDKSKISRIETGQRGIRARELRELLTAYGAHDEQQAILIGLSDHRRRGSAAWWQRYITILSGAYLEYLELEAMASRILASGPEVVPALVQTPAYAAAVAATDPDVPASAEANAIQAIAARQEAIVAVRQADLTVIVGEGALRRQVGTAQLMREQLQWLAEIGSIHPQVTVRVLPFSSGATALSGCGSLSVLQFQALPGLGLVHLAGPAGGVCLERPEEVTTYVQVFAQAQVAALSPAVSLALLRASADE